MFDNICYQKSFLKQVIARIDFAAPIDALNKSVPSKLLNPIVESFPIVEPSELQGHEVSIEVSGIKSRQTTNKQWNYFSKDRSRHLALTSTSVFVVYFTYKNYEETKDQFGKVIDALAKTYPDIKASRFGLRYVNQIELEIPNATNWDTFINADLLKTRGFFNDQNVLTRLINIAELRNDDVHLRFQFGMPNPDYPAEIKRPLYVLDLDASVIQAHDLNEISSYMDKAHEMIQDIFERSITPSLREKMDAKPIQ